MEEFRTFDSFEEMMEAERKQQAIAYKWIVDEQWEMADGLKHYFVQPVPYEDQILCIFGWTWDWEKEKKEVESESTDPMEKSERRMEIAHYKEAMTRGFVFARTFAMTYAYADGELGSVHISQCIEISESEFMEAKANGWSPPDSVQDKIVAFILRMRSKSD